MQVSLAPSAEQNCRLKRDNQEALPHWH